MEQHRDPWHNTDDFRLSHTGKWLTDAWDYPRNRTYRSLVRMVANNSLPRMAVFTGPTGSRKTMTAFQLGCAVSCEKFDPSSHAPCGVCQTCRHILTGKGAWQRGALFEIDGAGRSGDGTSDALVDINEAFRRTMGQRKQDGDENYPSIVFIDEAHRMTPGQRETLLKKSEKWCNGTIILATTRPDRLTVSGSTDGGNPLLNRCEVFAFDYPTYEECVAGLIRAATLEKLQLEPGVAEWIARIGRRCPRECLGLLYRLSNHGPIISPNAVTEEYGIEAWDCSKRETEGTATAPADGDRDQAFEPDLS